MTQMSETVANMRNAARRRVAYLVAREVLVVPFEEEREELRAILDSMELAWWPESVEESAPLI